MRGSRRQSLPAFRVQRAAASMRRWAARLPVLLCIRDAAAPMLPCTRLRGRRCRGAARFARAGGGSALHSSSVPALGGGTCVSDQTDDLQAQPCKCFPCSILLRRDWGKERGKVKTCGSKRHTTSGARASLCTRVRAFRVTSPPRQPSETTERPGPGPAYYG